MLVKVLVCSYVGVYLHLGLLYVLIKLSRPESVLIQTIRTVGLYFC